MPEASYIQTPSAGLIVVWSAHSCSSRLSFASISVLALTLAIGAPASAQTVSGRVVKAGTDDPVPSAMVALTEISHGTFTDDEGRFRLEGVPSGSYWITVDHLGYRPLERMIFVPPGDLTDLVLPVEARAIPMDSLRIQSMPERKRREQAWHSHHVLVTREEVEAAELRGAWHVGDVLRLYAPNAVRVQESVWLSTVCIRSTRAIGSRTLDSPLPGCAPLFLDGMRVGSGNSFLGSLSLTDIETIEFLPPMDALTRFGHAGENGAVLITTRVGAQRALWAGEGSEIPAHLGSQSHESYLAVGAMAGALVGFGAASIEYLLRDEGGICRSGCEWEIFKIVGSVLVGLGVGEALYRWGKK